MRCSEWVETCARGPLSHSRSGRPNGWNKDHRARGSVLGPEPDVLMMVDMMAGRGDIPPFRTSSPFGGSEQMERISLERGQERRLDGGPSFNVGLTGREVRLEITLCLSTVGGSPQWETVDPMKLSEKIRSGVSIIRNPERISRPLGVSCASRFPLGGKQWSLGKLKKSPVQSSQVPVTTIPYLVTRRPSKHVKQTRLQYSGVWTFLTWSRTV